MTEAELQDAIIAAAHAHGWLVHHDRPMRSAKGWRTGVQGDAGFPDLVLARAGAVLIIECKSERGRYEPGQDEWLRATAGWVVRPSDLDWLLARLGR